MLSKEELDEIDNWRFASRMPTRAAAVRELIRLGMKSAAKGAEYDKTKKRA